MKIIEIVEDKKLQGRSGRISSKTWQDFKEAKRDGIFFPDKDLILVGD